jgi:hypothetical protein
MDERELVSCLASTDTGTKSTHITRLFQVDTDERVLKKDDPEMISTTLDLQVPVRTRVNTTEENTNTDTKLRENPVLTSTDEIVISAGTHETKGEFQAFSAKSEKLL